MKFILTLLFIACTLLSTRAQVPQKFSYQSVIRDASNQALPNQAVGIKVTILQSSSTGAPVYIETHSTLTNANGLATLSIGGGTVLGGTFANINWQNGPYFIKTETDVNGGSNYTLADTQPLLSAPYSLLSKNVSTAVSATNDTLFIGSKAYVIAGISEANASSNQTSMTAHTCGAANVHNPANTYGTITDQEGNMYTTVLIGTQEWMAENLKTSIYQNGDPIANITANSQWPSLNTGAWCYYNNDSQFNCPYGKLYNWFAVADPRNVCPANWHVPTDDEWSLMLNYLDQAAAGGDELNTAGGKMKSSGLQYWLNPNQDASNESGFSSLPAGGLYINGVFSTLGEYSNYWSSTTFGPNLAWIRFMVRTNGDAHRLLNYKRGGFSVRCIRD